MIGAVAELAELDQLLDRPASDRGASSSSRFELLGDHAAA